MRDIKGFTLVEMLVALFCLSFCLLILIHIALVISATPNELFANDDMIAIRQLQKILAESDQFHLQSNTLYFQYRGQDTQLLFHNERIVKKPGYEIFLKDIKQGFFLQEENCYYVIWERNSHNKALLYCE